MAQEKYSFDVPDTWMNFTEMDETVGIDAWFDVRAALPTPLRDGAAMPAILPKAQPSRANLPRAVVSPMVKSDEKDSGGSSSRSQPSGEVPPNVVASLAEWDQARQEPRPPPARAPGRVVRNLSARRKSAQRRLLAKSQAERNTAALASQQEPPPSKKPKTCKNQEQLGEIDLNRNDSPVKGKDPSTPATLKKTNPPTKGKSTEELELEKMQLLQREVAELRQKNEESLKAAIAGPRQLVKTTSNITKPVDFHFLTDQRIKQQPGLEYKEVNFTSMLRKHPPSPCRAGKGPTIPKPFKLSGSKRKLDEATGYVSLAEQVNSFQSHVPARYHLRSRREEEAGPAPSKPSKPKLTHPRTPCLETKSRSRPVICKSTLELEEEEIAKQQQYKFKAQELNHRILEGAPLLPKKPQAKKPTKPVGFNLEIEKRIQERESKKPLEEEEHFEFHSRPCPTRILEDVVGVPEKQLLPITIPKSPAFALKNRVGALDREEGKEKVEEAAPAIRAQPVPQLGVPFRPKPAEPRLVEMCPFSFDSRDKERLLQKEKRIEELQKEEVPKFKAQPLPQFDHISLPEKKVKSSTKPEPFQLAVDLRGAVRQELWQQQLKEEMKRQKDAASFKAQASSVLHQEPFVPKKDSKVLLVPESFELATERRARERQEFERRLAELETEKAQLQEAAQRAEEQQAKEELARLREETVHRANPIRQYQNVDIKPSELPLTIPRSPNFSTRFLR